MAERRHRQVAADRRLISDRTAKGLRTLAAPQRVYRDRNVRGLTSRRSLNLTDYLVVPPEEMELDDDNDSLESAVEGARINYDLYDAYTNQTGLCASFLSSSFPSGIEIPRLSQHHRATHLTSSAPSTSRAAFHLPPRELGYTARSLSRLMGPTVPFGAYRAASHAPAVHSPCPGPLPDR